MEMEAAKLIGAGLAVIGVIGSGIGIGNIGLLQRQSSMICFGLLQIMNYLLMLFSTGAALTDATLRV